MVAREKHTLKSAELVREYRCRVGDIEQVIVQDRTTGSLPVRAERTLGVAPLGICIDQRSCRGVAREPELGVALS